MSKITDLSTLYSVKGLVAVITGGGTGLGLYAARALAANGAKAVYVVGRRPEPLEKAAKEDANKAIIPVIADVTSTESLQKVAEQVKKEQGYVNLVFANAGAAGADLSAELPPKGPGEEPYSVQEMQKAFLSYDMGAFTRAYEVNCTAVFYTAVVFLDLLDAGNKKGNVPTQSQVVVTGSIAGSMRSIMTGYSYCTSKAAALHIVKMLSTHLGPHGIRANLIAPGFFPSEMTDHVLRMFGEPTKEGLFAGSTPVPQAIAPLGRSGSEMEFIGTFLYLVSPAGAYNNGNHMVVDGGSVAQAASSY